MKKVFEITHEDHHTQARVGLLTTSRGILETPTFVPDATYGAVKHLSSQELEKMHLQMILGNVYHLGLRPGVNNIKKLGGLHSFMNWKKPIITDSGGWQVFSLVYRHQMGKILENGIQFKDHLSGKTHILTPHISIDSQISLGSDIMMCLDYPINPKDLSLENEKSVRLTTKWAKECYQAYRLHFPDFPNYPDRHNSPSSPILFAIIQGANDHKLRKQAFENLEAINKFPGYGFGGLPENEEILNYTARLIPKDRVRYVMGSGTPKDILKQVAMGYDLFDCVIPTRNARHGLLYTFKGEIRIEQEKYALDKKPIEDRCSCLACADYSRAYIRHLLKVKEPLGERLASLHNLTFYTRLMKKIRESIKKKQLNKFYQHLSI